MRHLYLYTRQRMLYPSLCFLVFVLGFSVKGLAQGDQNKDYHHWANTDNAWINGDLNKNNSTYKEGDVVPHAYTPSGLVNGQTYSFILRYDYDNTQRKSGGFAALVDPTGTVTPADYYDPTNNISGSGNLYPQNVTINNVTLLSDDNSGNTIIKQVQIDFTYTGATGNDAAIYFGLRLAVKDEIDTYGASVFPGASLDTRLDPQFGVNNGSRTLSIQTGSVSSGCDNPPSATISVDGPACDGSAVTVTFTGTGGTAPYTFFYNDPSGNPQSITSDNSGIATISVTTVGSFTYTLTGVADATDCGNAASGTVKAIVNAKPVVYTLAGNNDFCLGSSNGSVTLSSSESGVQYKLQVYNAGTDTWSDVANATKSGSGLSLTWAGLAAGKYRVVATNTTTTCSSQSNEVTLTGKACVTTFTQGFWGGTTANGKDCQGRTVSTILTSLLSTNPYVGVGTKSLTLNNVSKLISIMPGGGYVKNVFDGPYALSPYNLPSTYLDNKSKKLNSVVISQAIALKLNILYNNALGDVTFEAGKNILNTSVITYASTTSCTFKSVASTTTAFTMSSKVLCYLFANSSYSKDIKGLLQLANDVLGGALNVSTSSPFSYSDLVQTLDAINKGFDHGAMLKSYSGSYTCPTLAVTQRSVNASLVSEVPTDLSVATYPNPYSSNIRFMVANPKAGQGSLEVFNLLGQKVSTVYHGFIPAGTQTYNLNLSSLQRTNLIYRLRVGDKQVTGKLLHGNE